MGKGRQRARVETSAGGVVFRRVETGPVAYLLINDSYRHWGLPKGHVEQPEGLAEAARREVAEETGLDELVLHGPVGTIDWYFRFRGRLIHKYCHFFLFECTGGEAVPQREEGITACRWEPIEAALARLTYPNAREILRRAGDIVGELVRSPSGE